MAHGSRVWKCAELCILLTSSTQPLSPPSTSPHGPLRLGHDLVTSTSCLHILLLLRKRRRLISMMLHSTSSLSPGLPQEATLRCSSASQGEWRMRAACLAPSVANVLTRESTGCSKRCVPTIDSAREALKGESCSHRASDCASASSRTPVSMEGKSVKRDAWKLGAYFHLLCLEWLSLEFDNNYCDIEGNRRVSLELIISLADMRM